MFDFINKLPPANPRHNYFVKKKIMPIGIRQMSSDLLVPFQSIDNKIVGGQKIAPNGQKLNLPNSIVKESFFRIPKKSDDLHVFLVEGYATGVSVHQATGSEVIVCFGSTNLVAVSKFFPDAIIGADNDKVGIDSAKATGLRYTYPPNEGQDWNDYAQENTDTNFQIYNQLIIPSSVESKTFQETKSDDLNFIFLGHEKSKLYFFHKETKDIHEIDGENITIGKLIYLAPMEFWNQAFPASKKNDSCDIRSASDFLVRRSLESGKYIKNKIRGTGVWREGNHVVVNSLSNVWINDKHAKHGQLGKHIYIQENNDFLSLTRQAQKEKCVELFSLIQKLSWKNKTSADFLYGWLSLAPIAGMLDWRPHIWVTGGRGSGKSEVKREIVLPMLGLDIDASDNLGSSEAGIRQSKQVSATPLIYDEAEVTDFKTKMLMDSVIKTICLASDSSNSKVTKGSSHGESTSFSVRFCASLFSVGVSSLEHAQYRSRFSILELIENKENGYMGEGGTQDQLKKLICDNFPNEFFSRSIAEFENYKTNFKIFYEKLKDILSARFAQQIGSLLASSYTMQFLPVASEKDIVDFIKDRDLVEESEDNSTKNEEECLNFLMSKKIIESGRSYSIGELLEMVRGNDIEISEKIRFEALLIRHGIKFLEKDNVVAISNSHAELKSIFKGTSWESGWSRSIGRLPFVFKKSFQVKMNGQNQRCVCIDLNKT